VPRLHLVQAATEIRLVRNPHFQRRAAVDELHFVVLQANEDGHPARLVEALRRGDVDLTTALTIADLTAFGLTGLTPSMQPGNSTGILFFNTERPILSNPDVRRGMAMGIDGYEIASRSFDKNPAAFVAPNLLPPMMGRVSGIRSADREAARQLVDASGAKPSRLSLLVPWAPRPYLPKPLPAAYAIRRQLGKIGIDIEVLDTKTSDEFFGELVRGNYDLALAGWIADTPDPADFFEALLWSKMCQGDHHSNHSRWNDAATDDALARFRANPTEDNKRKIHRLVAEKAPLVPLIYGQSTVVHARKIRNVTMTATGVLSLAGVTVEF
jgi:ABC-type transport system substrate-binding protein